MISDNLACAEARLGEIDSAIGHLEEALAARPSLSELARNDTDLDALRGDARFERSIAAPAAG